MDAAPTALPVHATVTTAGLRVHVWSHPGTSHPNQDRWLATGNPATAPDTSTSQPST